MIDSSTNISNEIYDANWYSIKDLKVKRMIVLVMRMSQSPKSVSGCDFVEICHKTFSTVRILFVLFYRSIVWGTFGYDVMPKINT